MNPYLLARKDFHEITVTDAAVNESELVARLPVLRMRA
jgi:hypothetical protein